MFIQLWSHINVSSLDGRKHQLSHSLALLVDEVGLEQSLTRLEPLPPHLDHPPVWQGVLLHQECGLLSQLLLGMNVVANIAELLLHHPHRLEVSRVVEGIPPQQQQLDQVPRDIPAWEAEQGEDVDDEDDNNEDDNNEDDDNEGAS